MSSEPTVYVVHSSKFKLVGNLFPKYEKKKKKKPQTIHMANSKKDKSTYTLKHNKAVVYALFCIDSFCIVNLYQGFYKSLQII